MQHFNPLAQAIVRQKYLWENETWAQLAERVAGNVLWAIGLDSQHPIVKEVATLIRERKFLPAGRYLAAAGRQYHQVQNCLCLGVEDSREGWATLMKNASMALMSGAGIGVDYSKIRPRGAAIRKTGGIASGPVGLMQMLNEAARHIQQGGHRRAAILAQLLWSHPNIDEFIRIKQWSEEIKKIKEKSFDFPAPLDRTNISIRIDDAFLSAYQSNEAHAQLVYNEAIRQMCQTGEPGFAINLREQSEHYYANACGEYRSAFSDNVCNLGSINLARIDRHEEFAKVVELGSLFLYAGTVYSDVPYAEVETVRAKTRQIGLGLMGIHEWLLKRGFHYGDEPEELKKWLLTYTHNLESLHGWPQKLGLASPERGRAIAPTGTISILGETTGGAEPLFCAAYKRRYIKGGTWAYQYVVDPTAKRLIEEGMKETEIEDAYSISLDKRLSFQAFLQRYVDMAISSTINIPRWGSEQNNQSTLDVFGKTIMTYLSQLRGITVFPDGSRGVQPLVPVKYSTASKQAGIEFTEEAADVCDIRGGSCGS